MDNPQTILNEIAKRRVLVIGDTIVDVNSYTVRGSDLDDGTPVYRKVFQEHAAVDRYSLGGAALVVRNLLELGATVDFLTVVGYGQGYDHASNFRQKNLSLHPIRTNQPQTVKHRIWCDGRKVLQTDQMSLAGLDEAAEDFMLQMFERITERRTDKPEVIVIADYRHGMISQAAAEHFVERYPNQPPVIVSSQVSQFPSNHNWYRGATSFVLNAIEAEAIMPFPGGEESDYVAALREKLGSSNVVVTLGAAGCLSADELVGGFRTVPAIDLFKVVDTCGAGDAFLAAFAVTGMVSFANLWAGLSCTVPGANPPSKEMLKEYGPAEGNLLGEDRNGAVSHGGDEAHHDEGRDTFFS